MKVFVSRLDAALDVIATLQRERRALRQELRRQRAWLFFWHDSPDVAVTHLNETLPQDCDLQIARIDKVLKSKRKVKAK